MFDAFDAVAALDRLEAGLHDVPFAEARAWFAAQRRYELPSLDHLAEDAPLLLLAGDSVDDRHDRRVHVERERGRRAALGQLYQAQGVGERIGTDAAEPSRHGQAEQTRGVQIAVVLDRERGFRVEPGSPRGKACARQLGNLFDQTAAVRGDHGRSPRQGSATRHARVKDDARRARRRRSGLR